MALRLLLSATLGEDENIFFYNIFNTVFSVCACGKWICTSNKCPEKHEQDLRHIEDFSNAVGGWGWGWFRGVLWWWRWRGPRGRPGCPRHQLVLIMSHRKKNICSIRPKKYHSKISNQFCSLCHRYLNCFINVFNKISRFFISHWFNNVIDSQWTV